MAATGFGFGVQELPIPKDSKRELRLDEREDQLRLAGHSIVDGAEKFFIRSDFEILEHISLRKGSEGLTLLECEFYAPSRLEQWGYVDGTDELRKLSQERIHGLGQSVYSGMQKEITSIAVTTEEISGITLMDLIGAKDQVFDISQTSKRELEKLSTLYSSVSAEEALHSLEENLRDSIRNVEMLGFSFPRRQFPFVFSLAYLIVGLCLFRISKNFGIPYSELFSHAKLSTSVFSFIIDSKLSFIIGWIIIQIAGALLILVSFRYGCRVQE